MSSETFRRLLLEANVLDDARLQKAEAAASSRGASLERTIVALNLADEVTVWRALAKAVGQCDQLRSRPTLVSMQLSTDMRKHFSVALIFL